MTKERLLGKTLGELGEVAASLGMPRFAAGQLARWLYKKGVGDIALMSDLPLSARQRLAESYTVGLTPPAAVEESRDGTKKYLFATDGGHGVEAAYIPEWGRGAEPHRPTTLQSAEPGVPADGGKSAGRESAGGAPQPERATLCLSSQAGCRMGCLFCMTARQGLQHNLSSGEIINQIASLPERDTLTNIVYMGMGEPLDNLAEVIRSLDILTSEWGYAWSPTRITVSTIGLLPQLTELLDRTRVHVAISLHDPFPGERLAIMPAEKAFPIEKVVAELRRHDFAHQRRVSFEYIVFKGLNDTPRHVKELARLLNGLRCRINLIRFHAIPGSPFESPDRPRMEALRDALASKGIITTIRASRGEDIRAACGLLSTKK